MTSDQPPLRGQLAVASATPPPGIGRLARCPAGMPPCGRALHPGAVRARQRPERWSLRSPCLGASRSRDARQA